MNAVSGGQSPWRVNPDATLDADLASNLFRTTPEVILTADSGGREPDILGVQATLTARRSVEEYNSHVLANCDAVDGHWNSPSTTYYGPDASTTLTLARYEKSESDVLAEADQLAQSVGEENDDEKIGVDAEIDLSDPRRYIEPGDNIYAYDLAEGIIDTANQVTYGGRTIHPLARRVEGMTWPIRHGHGVYHVSSDGNDTVTDLTPYVAWESGPVRLAIGDVVAAREPKQPRRFVKPAKT